RHALPPSIESATSITGAVASALQQLKSLQAAAGELGRDILQFQVEMLEDDLLVAEMLALGKELSPQGAIASVLNDQIANLLRAENEAFQARGIDIADLRDRLLAAFGGASEEGDLPEDTILLVRDMTPSRFLEIDWNRVKGIAAHAGSTSSHVALLARSQSVPMLVGIGEPDASALGRPALLDAISGRLIVDPDEAELKLLSPTAHGIAVSDEEGVGPAIMPDGSQVRIYLSVNSLATLDETPREWFDGIGLVRTELLLHDPADVLRRDALAQTYRRLFDWAEDRPVTIRLFDAGGDKPLAGFSLPGEANAFLGTRGARLLARRPDVLRIQYEAILDAADERSVRIVIPMLTLPQEMAFFRETLEQTIADHGAAPTRVSLGMMVETPSAALEIRRFGADFFSIGTNDLIQHTLAVSRDSDALEIGEELAPAVVELIARVANEGRLRGSEVTLCGDAATSRVQLKQIFECGIRSIAIPGRFAPRFKHFIRHGE
ncbi:MAG TPA: putative PEP-binding protein, partial [Planctomycetaceae bacterium]|nr:putative PEP-binding protein [Planctomycetaceae bacterium]